MTTTLLYTLLLAVLYVGKRLLFGPQQTSVR